MGALGMYRAVPLIEGTRASFSKYNPADTSRRVLVSAWRVSETANSNLLYLFGVHTSLIMGFEVSDRMIFSSLSSTSRLSILQWFICWPSSLSGQRKRRRTNWQWSMTWLYFTLHSRDEEFVHDVANTSRVKFVTYPCRRHHRPGRPRWGALREWLQGRCARSAARDSTLRCGTPPPPLLWLASSPRTAGQGTW